MTTSPGLSPADAKVFEAQQYAQATGAATLKVGELLLEIRDQGHWLTCTGHGNWPKFRDFLESLGVKSPNYWNRIIRLIEARNKGDLNECDIAEMGLSCAIELLPLIRNNALTPEILEAAKTKSVTELRIVLGKMPKERKARVMHCSNCGEEIQMLCPRCREEVSL